MKLISWNVNGIKSVLRKGFEEFARSSKADIICLQETKSPKDKIEINLPGYEQFWNYAEKAGYSGTAVFTKIKPVKVTYDLGIAKHDKEGRMITVEFSKFFLVNVYVPNSKRKLERLSYRTEEWDVDFLKYLKKLEKRKPVVFCGDLNVAHTEIDLANPKGNVKNHGFTPEERAQFENVLKAGFLDTFREFEKGGDHYTWWSPMNNCRGRNIGWRIDYFLISPALRKNLKSSVIMKDVMGSDHCPVAIEMKF
ncbi:MAG: exodeoxyribonuclease III [Candidatus Omnitrophica bacterium]|nr:exodeoxyribonuclease III [Candidatus Omnitrophota bacterium]